MAERVAFDVVFCSAVLVLFVSVVRVIPPFAPAMAPKHAPKTSWGFDQSARILREQAMGGTGRLSDPPPPPPGPVPEDDWMQPPPPPPAVNPVGPPPPPEPQVGDPPTEEESDDSIPPPPGPPPKKAPPVKAAAKAPKPMKAPPPGHLLAFNPDSAPGPEPEQPKSKPPPPPRPAAVLVPSLGLGGPPQPQPQPQTAAAPAADHGQGDSPFVVDDVSGLVLSAHYFELDICTYRMDRVGIWDGTGPRNRVLLAELPAGWASSFEVQARSDSICRQHLGQFVGGGGWKYASRKAMPPTLVYDPVRDGPSLCRARVWIAPLDPLFLDDEAWLRGIGAITIYDDIRACIASLLLHPHINSYIEIPKCSWLF